MPVCRFSMNICFIFAMAKKLFYKTNKPYVLHSACTVFLPVMIMTDTVSYDHVLLKPGEQIGLHHWNSWEMSYIISGEGRRILGGTEEPFCAGEVVLVVPEMPHQWIFAHDKTDRDGNIENITISFPPDLLNMLSRVMPEFSQLAEWYGHLDTSIKFKPSECKKIAAVLRRMEHESALERTMSLLQLLVSIQRNRNFTVAGRFAAPHSVEEKIKNIEVYISCNYNHDFSIDSLAKYVGMNSSALCTMFKRHTGETIIEHLKNYRIGIAKYLLASTSESISSCCYSSGFNDVPHFNRTFRQMVGMTPGEYRARHSR